MADGKEIVYRGLEGTGAAQIYDNNLVDRGLDEIAKEDARNNAWRQKVGQEMKPKPVGKLPNYKIDYTAKDQQFLLGVDNDIKTHLAKNINLVTDPNNQEYWDGQKLMQLGISYGAKAKENEATYNAMVNDVSANPTKFKDGAIDELNAWYDVPLDQRPAKPPVLYKGATYDPIEFSKKMNTIITNPDVVDSYGMDNNLGAIVTNKSTEYSLPRKIAYGAIAGKDKMFRDTYEPIYEALPDDKKQSLQKKADEANKKAGVDTFTPFDVFAAQQTEVASQFNKTQDKGVQFLPKDMRGGGSGNKEAAQTFAMRVKQMMTGSPEMYGQMGTPSVVSPTLMGGAPTVTERGETLEFLNGMTIGEKADSEGKIVKEVITKIEYKNGKPYVYTNRDTDGKPISNPLDLLQNLRVKNSGSKDMIDETIKILKEDGSLDSNDTWNSGDTKSVPKSTIKNLVGKKGYEGYTEQELIEYYKSQGYNVE